MVKGCEILTPSASSLTLGPGDFAKALSLKSIRSSLAKEAPCCRWCMESLREKCAREKCAQEAELERRGRPRAAVLLK